MNQAGRTFYVILTGSVSVKIYMPPDEEKSEDRIIEIPPGSDRRYAKTPPNRHSPSNSVHKSPRNMPEASLFEAIEVNTLK
jgi:hypothetical protein